MRKAIFVLIPKPRRVTQAIGLGEACLAQPPSRGRRDGSAFLEDARSPQNLKESFGKAGTFTAPAASHNKGSLEWLPMVTIRVRGSLIW